MFKQKDLPIIGMLRSDARISLTDIGKKTGIPISTVYDRMRYHEGTSIIKYATLVDFNHFGFMTRAHILLAVPKEKREETREFLCKHQSINSVYKINNNYDFLVEAVFRHIKHLEDFIDVVDQRFQANKIEVHHIIDDLKREAFMEDAKMARAMLENE